MLFNVNISPAQPGAPNFNIQVEAADLIAALEAAKGPILKSARDTQSILANALPTAAPSPPVEPAPK